MIQQDTKWRACKLTLFIIGLSLICTYYTWNGIYPHSFQLQTRKQILIWNSPHRIETAVFGTGHVPFSQCPTKSCNLVVNRSDIQGLENFDAVLFHVHELWLSSLPPESYKRPAHQRFVLLTQESPQSMARFDPAKYNNYFNWTMSYRRDSDIQMLYGRVYPAVNSTKSVRHVNKTKTIAWMVSHCHTFSKREEYVRKLQEHIKVDVYGGCGPLKCARNASHWLSEPECYVQLSSQYKFYLSFENSICHDYVTEKFFNILQYDMVPVVLGGADYASIAPPNSYIDTKWFKSPADLAAYLHLLDGHDNLYKKFFEWKSKYVVESGVPQMSRHAFCDLCAKLHEPETPKFYSSLLPQWSSSLQCNNSKL